MKNLSTKQLSLLYVCIIFGLILVVQFISQRFYFRTDLTENKNFSISEVSKERLGTLAPDISIEVYVSNNLPPQADKIRLYIKDLLEEFESNAQGNLSVIWKNPSTDQEAMNEAHTIGIMPVNFETIEKDQYGVVAAYLGIAIRKGDDLEVIPSVHALPTLEYQLLKGLNNLMNSREKIGFLKTDTMPSIDPLIAAQWGDDLPPDLTQTKYRILYDVLKKEYDLSYIDVTQITTIDPTIKTLVVIGDNPVYFDNARVLYVLDQFLMQGGNLVLFTPRISVQINDQGRPRPYHNNVGLFSMLSSYGIAVDSSLVFDRYAGSMTFQAAEGNDRQMYPLILDIREDRISSKNPACNATPRVLIPWANPISVKAPQGHTIAVDTLFRSSDTSFSKALPLLLTVEQDWQLLFGNALQENRFQSFPVGIHATGSFTSFFKDKELPPNVSTLRLSCDTGSIILMTTAGLFSEELPPLTVRENSQFNVPFVINLVDWLVGKEHLIALRSKTLEDRSIWQESVFSEGQKATQFYRFINVLLMPTLVIILGLALYLRRRTIQRGV